jgi:cytochrome c-type biogenesis protein CcmH
MLRHAFIALLVSFLASQPARAVQPDEMLNDPVLESRARDLSRELRCMVCQNQSIDDSEAPLARDLRLLVRERLTNGDSDQQVIDYLVSRYGQFVLLKPPLEWHTLILWGLPPAVLIAGLIGLVSKLAAKVQHALELKHLAKTKSGDLQLWSTPRFLSVEYASELSNI